MSDGPEWFAPKRYGYGAGLPISWQGWALTIGFVALVIGARRCCFSDHPLQLVAALAPFIIAFIVICARTTRGGWRWRWGERRLADRQVALLVDQPPLVEVGRA